MGQDQSQSRRLRRSKLQWYSDMGVRHHVVEPADTLQSICSRYGVSESALRRANFGLVGSNVQGGPKRLVVPNTISISTKDGNTRREAGSERGVRSVRVDYPTIGDIFVEEECLVQCHEVQLRDAMIKPLPFRMN